MKIVCISDTHEKHDQLIMPPGDVLIVSGDVTMNGGTKATERFLLWLDRQEYKYKIFVAGNHDFFFEGGQLARNFVTSVAPSVMYLQDNEVTIQGTKFYGAPWTPKFYDWAFMLQEKDIAKKWKLIPDDTEVLITHGPPFAVLDKLERGERVGCKELAKRVDGLEKLKLHVFGHIHSGYGQVYACPTMYINAAVCGENYQVVNSPIVYNL